ncbi:MAG: dual CXXC motif small (seleno)protein [Solidesulfovibrio sp.]
MAFSRVTFEPSMAKGLTCPSCNGPLTFERTCLHAMLTCKSCRKDYDPALFVEQLDDDFEEAYANIPMNRM